LGSRRESWEVGAGKVAGWADGLNESGAGKAEGLSAGDGTSDGAGALSRLGAPVEVE
jgi:hypothetical protein